MQLFAMDEHTTIVKLISGNSIEMVNLTCKREREQIIADAKIKTDYYVMMQEKIKNKIIEREHAESIHKECAQYNFYSYLIPIDKDQNSKFHHLVYKRDPRIPSLQSHCPSIFAHFPNKYGCTANSIIATNKKGLCYDLHKKHQG